MVKSDSRTSKSIKKQFDSVGVLFHQPDSPILFKEDFLGLFGSRGTGGLNTTAQNLLGFLNLAELGIGTAVAYSLYKAFVRERSSGDQ